ncbi:MAG: hypothetical protein O3A51_07170 [Verrucomicrobia bacterium]|nr:hypothetical protein [Verrucomicrobiota bacterium]
MKIGVPIPFWKREDIAKASLRHWCDLQDELFHDDILLVLTGGYSDPEYLDRLEPPDEWSFSRHNNLPLATKWNDLTESLREHRCDAIVVSGMDDFFDAQYFRSMADILRAGHAQGVGSRTSTSLTPVGQKLADGTGIITAPASLNRLAWAGFTDVMPLMSWNGVPGLGLLLLRWTCRCGRG